MSPEQRIAELEALIRKARAHVAADVVGPMEGCTCVQCEGARLLKEIDERVPPV